MQTLLFSGGRFFYLFLRVFSLKDFFLNWDLVLGPLSISYCWCREHRLFVAWRPIRREDDGVLRYSTLRRAWAFGLTDNGRKKLSSIWHYAHEDKLRGEWQIDHFPGRADERVVRIWFPRFRVNDMPLLTYWRRHGASHMRIWRKDRKIPSRRLA